MERALGASFAELRIHVGSVRLTPDDKAVYISDLEVGPEHRRHGLARQLVQAAMRTARSKRYLIAQLEARSGSHSDLSQTAAPLCKANQ
ncbi:MAG: GNAT family N-acetyltransferase [Bryobacteraceae bacterium]